MTIDRQGRFKGDLNTLQRTSLVWLMNYEIDEQVGLERSRTENTALASNPATSTELLKALFEERQEIEVFDEDWSSPESIEDIEDFLSVLSASPNRPGMYQGHEA